MCDKIVIKRAFVSWFKSAQIPAVAWMLCKKMIEMISSCRPDPRPVQAENPMEMMFGVLNVVRRAKLGEMIVEMLKTEARQLK